MTHTITLQLETGPLSPDEMVELSTYLVEMAKRAPHVYALTTSRYSTSRGYIISSDERTSDICAPDSPDMRYQS